MFPQNVTLKETPVLFGMEKRNHKDTKACPKRSLSLAPLQRISADVLGVGGGRLIWLPAAAARSVIRTTILRNLFYDLVSSGNPRKKWFFRPNPSEKNRAPATPVWLTLTSVSFVSTQTEPPKWLGSFGWHHDCVADVK